MLTWGQRDVSVDVSTTISLPVTVFNGPIVHNNVNIWSIVVFHSQGGPQVDQCFG